LIARQVSIESYYRATAETFYCSVGKTPRSREFAREQVLTVLNALKRLGFNLEFDDNKISQLVDVQRELGECCSSGKFENAIADLDDVDFLTKQTVQEYAETLSMSDKEFAEQHENKKKFRNLLISLVKK
jgi:hypothetical protein